MTPPVDIAGLRGLLAEATPRPWCEHPNGTSIWTGSSYDDVCDEQLMVLRTVRVAPQAVADLALVAAAVNALPALCDRVEELEREVTFQAKRADHFNSLRECWHNVTDAIVLRLGIRDNRCAAASVQTRAIAAIAALEEENARLRAEVERLEADLADDDGWFYSWCCDNNGITPGPGFYPTREDTIARAMRSGPEERGGARSFFLFRIKRLDMDEVFVDESDGGGGEG